MTLNERLIALFRRHTTSGGLALVFVFAAGLLAAATPCVYPVLPITSAFLIARGAGSQRRGRLHALVYFAGMIFFYALLGLMAFTTGTALSAIMTHAWVNLGFAVVFAYFGLSMLGLYEFQGLTTFSARLDAMSSHWSGFSGTFFLGTTAGLVVSPCVGPIAGTILLDITRQAANANATGSLSAAGMPLWGLVLMASFGVGLGLPS
jgi:thiol:disulfide interchange protein DsbD